MSDSPYTHREVEQLNQSLRDLNTTIRELQREFAVTYARKDVIEPRVAEIEKDVAKQSGYWDWLVRLVVGAVVVALLGLVITNGGAV
jgi:hypothetical protein